MIRIRDQAITALLFSVFSDLFIQQIKLNYYEYKNYLFIWN